MVAVLDNPAVRAQVKPCSVERYHRLGELSMLSEHTELLRGAIVEKMPQSPIHASTVEMLREHFERSLPPGTFVRQEKPLTFSDSEPEPDLAVVRGARGEYLSCHPSTAALVVEVAVSSEALDRLKLDIYAENGVPECWLVFPESRAVERYSRLQNGVYCAVERRVSPATLASSVFPELVLLPAGFFPEVR